MSRIFILTYENISEDAISIQVDTSYLHWNNTFPAISLCLSKGRSTVAIKAFVKEYFDANNLTYPKRDMNFLKLIQTYLFQSPNVQIDELDQFCDTLNTTCGSHLETLQNLFFVYSCKAFMFDLTYLGEKYDNCEDLFKFEKTEVGFCFSANSLHY